MSTSYISAGGCAGFIVLISDGIEAERKNKDIAGILFLRECETKRGSEVHSSRVIKQGNKTSTKKRLEDRIN